jgi:hypothetical protein
MNKFRVCIAVISMVFASLACKTVLGTQETPVILSLPVDPTQTESIPELSTIVPVEEPTSTHSLTPTEILPLATQPEDNVQKYDTEYPLPDNISGFIDTGNNSINFQAKINLKDAISFYREKFTAQGYKEREINTTITDTVFSLVFDGHSSGKAIVIQGVDLGDGSVNINIRLEDV